MPVRLDTEPVLRVSEQAGRIVRNEVLPVRTDLHERWALAHENYARQRWTVGEWHKGQWAFVAEKGARRFLIAIRVAQSVAAAAAAGALNRV